jgi:hypothetical protein
MATDPIPLGFAVGSAAAVSIPLKHLAITGMTQEAGKTTALEALISRAGRRAIAFITKRGEAAFRDGHTIAPYFRERADWVFVSSLIDATLGEKNKLLRAWLMKVCRNTKTLAEVQRNVRAAKAEARGFSESIYTEIEGYLELVVPQLAELPPARELQLVPGLNVMNLAPYSTELQALVIRSVLDHVHDELNDTITVIPEAWEFLPERRGSPVKLAAEGLIRKGASLRNYLWIDSQDLAGVSKTILRSCAVVLIGVQREANEIRRTLENIHGAKPTSDDVAALQLGQFYACYSHRTIKTYVQPAWMTDDLARQIAGGAVDVATAKTIDRVRTVRRALTHHMEDHVTSAEARRLSSDNATLRAENTRLQDELVQLRRQLGHLEATYGGHDPTPAPTMKARVRAAAAATDTNGGAVTDAFYAAIKERLIAEAPELLRVLVLRPELEVTIERSVITADGASPKGRVARLIKSGFVREPKRFNEVLRELERTGPRLNNKSLAIVMKDLVAGGFLTKEAVDRYQAVPDAIVRVVER